jgi:hypothetical protein
MDKTEIEMEAREIKLILFILVSSLALATLEILVSLVS